VGAALTLLVGLLKRELSPQGMRSALLGTAETTAMVFMIFLGADMMNATLALTEMPKLVAQWVTHLPIPGIAVVLAVLLLYVLLGCVMDELSMLLLTIPVIFPAIMALDLWGLKYEAKALWFGILVLMTVGIGMIAPPIGLNVYVVNSMAKDVPMAETYKGVMPFLVWDALRLLALLCFPVLALGLVKLLFP
jgi:TRAP-type C4-dicarboxylate transport system permease large subunit